MCSATRGGVAHNMVVYKARLYRRLIVLLLLVTVGLWAVINGMLLLCDPLVELPPFSWTSENGAVMGAELDGIEAEVVKWFMRKLPAHALKTVQSSCPPTHHHSSEDSFFSTLAAVGDLHLPLTNHQAVSESLFANVSTYLSGVDAVVTDFASVISDRDQHVLETLRSLRAMGIRLVSLANDHIRQDGDQGTTATLHALEAADIRWLGLNAKQHEIVVMKGQKIGFLAFCGVHGQCIEPSSTPFAPLKYSSKVASLAVSELKEHGVSIIIVLMHWGLENSYFPDETALTIARHLAKLGVTLVIGHHPLVVQDHAYFGNTLILFSLGNLIISDAPFCWHKRAGQWYYSITDHCKAIHPGLRQGLLQSQQHTRLYKISLSRSGTVVAEYLTLPLDSDPSFPHVKRPRLDTEKEWTIVCGKSDHHCLSCEPL